MSISLNKQAHGAGLTRVGASLTADHNDGSAARLTAVIFEGESGEIAIVDHRNTRSVDGAVVLTSTVGDGEGVEADLARLPRGSDTVALCISRIGSARSRCGARGTLRLFDFAEGEEIGRYDLSELGDGVAYEFGRFERAGERWRFRSTGRDPGEAFERAVRRDPLIARTSTLSTTPAAAPDPQNGFREVIAARGLTGYCDADERGALLREGERIGLDVATARALLDLTLERSGIANEAVLLERLEKMLRQFTDKDRSLDRKEQSDALQMVCRPAAGFAKGLRADVADRAVIDFCRARGVKIKAGRGGLFGLFGR